MEVKPVEQIEKPKYPLKTELNADELKKQIPKRWMQSPAAKIALGTLAAITLAGCAPAGGISPPTLTTETSASPFVDAMPMGEVLAPSINVAPLFEYGKGRGSCGCVMVAPPVFLSEDEALVVVNEVALEYGIEFSANGSPEFTNVLQPTTNIYSSDDQKLSDKTMTFKADFADSEHRVIIGFISVEDVKKWHQDTGYACSVENYNTKDAADQLSDALEQAAGPGYTAGVFYDPCEIFKIEGQSDREGWSQEQWEAALEEAKAKAREMSEEQLKKQAIDFFEWLKSQGVI